MHLATISRIFGILLMLFSFTMLPPMAIAWFHQHDADVPFFVSFALTFFTGLMAWLPARHHEDDLKSRDGFVIVALFWVVLSLFGALPFMLAAQPHMSFTNAMFEAASGLTTTGASVLYHIDELPKAILYYRQQLQFLGGMGIIVLAVAVLPMLRVGGLQLYRAETPGPLKDEKLTPRITETAKALWYIYLSLTLLCFLCYWAAGMEFFDAIGESFSTVATGGFSIHDASFAFYHSPLIEYIATFFMILSSINFTLHFAAFRECHLGSYWKNTELRVFLTLLACLCVVTLAVLLHHQVYPVGEAIRKSIFNATSLATTTGLLSAHFHTWPGFISILMLFSAIIGGCAASTSGGLKIMRVILIPKQIAVELTRLVHPKAVLSIKFGDKVLQPQIIAAMWAFLGVFVIFLLLLSFALMGLGENTVTAFSAATACLTNAGVGIGSVADGFFNLSHASKWILIFAMFAGRLEIFTLLVLFTPGFWRR